MTDFIPLLVTTSNFTAQLNQDGSWTFIGEELSIDNLNGVALLIVKKLIEIKPINNLTPNNIKPITMYDATEIALADPSARVWVGNIERELEEEIEGYVMPASVTKWIGYHAVDNH